MTQKKSPTLKINPPAREHAFRLLFENHPIPMWVYDLKTLAFLDVNDAALEKYGYTRSEFLALTIKDIRPPEDVANLINNLELKRPSLQHSGEWRHRLKNGRGIDVEITSHTLDFEGHKAALVMAQDITERKQAEEELQASQQTLKLFVEYAPASIAMLDRDMKYIAASRRYITDYRLTDSDIIGRSHYEVFPEIPERWKEIHRRCLAGAAEKADEDPFPRADGTLDWVRWEVRPWYAKSGEIGGIFLFTEVITERKQAENALRESEEKFKYVFDHSVIGKSITLPSGEIHVNRAFCDMLGYSQEELQDRKWLEITHPDDIESTQKEVNSLLSGAKEWARFTKRYVHKNGSVVWADVGTSLRRDKDGKALYLMTTISDITARKQAEAALLENKLTAERYLNIAAEIIVALDREGNITRLNESGHQLLGYETTELIGKNWFDTCLTEDARIETRHIFEMMKNGEISGMESHENSVLTKNGEEKIILWHNTVLRDDENRFMGTLSSGEDITIRMEMEKALRIALAKYKTLFEYFPLGITISDGAGNILETNPTAAKLLAVPREEHNQHRIDDPEWRIVRPDGITMPPDEFAGVRALKEKRVVENAEMGIIKPDHNTTWLSVTAAPLPVEGHGVVITFGDITARKQTENTLQARVRLSQFAESHTLDELLQKTLDEAEALTGSQIGFAHFLEADQKTLELQTWSTNTLKNMCTAEGKGLHYPVDQAGVWVDCISARAPVIHNDYANLPASRRKGLPQGHTPVIRELVVPILRGELIVAVFGVGNKPGDYNNADVEAVLQLANLTWDIVQRKRAEDELQNAKNALEKTNQDLQAALVREKQLAHTDMLTGVNNRRYLYELAAREVGIARRYHQPLSMLMFDLDHFKNINDTFGHAVGDQVLVRVIQAACAELRSTDVIGRYGGEEFVILLPVTNAQQAYPLAERIRESVAAVHVPTPMGDAFVTLSIGIIEMKQTSARGESVDSMIRRADQAMYAAKQAGRNCSVIFDRDSSGAI